MKGFCQKPVSQWGPIQKSQGHSADDTKLVTENGRPSMYRVLHKWRNEVKTDIRGKIHCIKHTNIAKCLYILGDFHSGTPEAYY